ncbi:hypothetical protein CAPTEDRAFT_209379 [Capitella teleta]|uniref:Uncharacterized protein n=1 Tax=Capitella teleta TaxID=283909 RepID=R7T5Z4_CAPTE|nr:hypothetical protein CAPTEDRAFT_209379 [Capitella teleta]|eukprot:ELT88740.1 hypothetical protein CAPTEDRAFT_209379 [Capitella teleta]
MEVHRLVCAALGIQNFENDNQMLAEAGLLKCNENMNKRTYKCNEMSYKPLTAFPDFRKMKDTLVYIDLKGNEIQKIPRTEVDYMTKISKIVLAGNPLKQLPKLTIFLLSLTWLDLRGIQLECFWNTTWMKRIPDTLTLIGFSQRRCSHPSKWNMMNRESITEDMLLQQTCGEHIRLELFQPIRKLNGHDRIEALFTRC